MNQQIEHMQMKYTGTGHPDTTKFEWVTHHHRDSYSSYISHYPLSAYFAIAQNESVGRLRYEFLQKMIKPCGDSPHKDEEKEQ